MLYDSSASSYFRRAFTNIDAIAEELKNAVESAGVSYDTMIGTGLSGTLVVPSLARLLNVRYWAIIRKEMSPHSSTDVEGSVGHRWLFVDDFICSGATVRRVRDCMQRKVPGTQYVGTYSYERRHFTY